LQDSGWSRALRACLERHFGMTLEASCDADASDRLRYAQALEAAGFERVREIVIEYSDALTFDQLIDGVYSAIPADELPEREDRPAFAEIVRQSLPPVQHFAEDVRVSLLVGLIA
jgi:hypothetical protein